MDYLNAKALLVLAQMPGQNITPQAPAGFGSKVDQGLNFAMYLGIVVAIIGVITMGAAMALSRQQGSSEEATSRALAIGIGCLLIGGASGLVGAFL